MASARPRSFPRFARVALGLVAAFGSTSAAAEPGLALAPDSTPAGDAGLLTSSPDARGAPILRGRLLLDRVARPLVLVDGEQREEAVVEEQVWLRAGLSLALWHRALVYAELPFAARVTDGPAAGPAPVVAHPTESSGLGDLKAGLRVRLLGPAGAGAQLGAGAEFWAPTGAQAAYAGDGAARARLFVAWGATLRRTQWSLEGGYTFRKSERLAGILPTRVGSAIVLGASLRTALDVHATVSLGPELFATLGVADGASLFDLRSSAVQVLLAGRYRPLGLPLELGAGFGPGLGRGAGAGDYRALAFVGWCPEVPAPPPDRDSDGVADANDICVGLPGVASEDPLMNGCPAVPLDGDGDGIPDAFDACPRAPGIATRVARTHGCPKPVDRDRDTIPDAEDACPDERGVKSAELAKNGCPAPPPPAASLVESKIVISEQVQFETGTAVLRAESDGILTQVLDVLRAHPELELVEVEGHTDNTGTPELNRRLSQERAASVMNWLVVHGIVTARLVAKGYGQDRALADNATEAGRAKNRRVEFRVVRGPGGQGGKR